MEVYGCNPSPMGDSAPLMETDREAPYVWPIEPSSPTVDLTVALPDPL